MTEQPHRGVGGVIPHLTIREGRAADAIAFYQRAFDAREIGRHLADDGRRIMHAHLVLNGGDLMLNDDFPEMMGAPSAPPGSVVLHLQVADADTAWRRALEAGASERFPLADQFWGDRYGQVEDPFGFTWSIGAPVAKGAGAEGAETTPA